MKCNWCGKEYTHTSVRQQTGTMLYAEYGCCSEQCYKNHLSNVPKPPNPESQG